MSSRHERRAQVARLKKAQRRKDNPALDLSQLVAGTAALDVATATAVAISERNIGKIHTGRQRRALLVFSKMIAHNTAVLALTEKFSVSTEDGLLDHFSMAVLARAIIDAALMSAYITEPTLSLNQWDFRRQLLFLHDHNNRSRFLKPLAKEGIGTESNDGAEVKTGIQSRIQTLGAELGYQPAKIEEFVQGRHLFLDGVRGAVREAGWDVDEFDFLQSYLSAYVHSHPVSWMRADEHRLSFQGASRFQVDFCHFLLTVLAGYTEDVSKRMDSFSVPGIGDPNGHLE